MVAVNSFSSTRGPLGPSVVLVVAILLWVGCSQPMTEPAPDIDATVQAAIAKAMPTETLIPTPDIQATVEAAPTATPTLVPTPAFTPVPTATATPTPTITPAPKKGAIVRAYYAVPSDVEVSGEEASQAVEAITAALIDVQQWYDKQLEGESFRLHEIRLCNLGQPVGFFATEGWVRLTEEIKKCEPPFRDWDKAYVTVIYAEIPECFSVGERVLGRAQLGKIMLGYNHLDILLGRELDNPCGFGWYPDERKDHLGAMAHEMAHALGIQCHGPNSSLVKGSWIMGHEWYDYPGAGFTARQKKMLQDAFTDYSEVVRAVYNSLLEGVTIQCPPL